jgi:hypothetical protein
MHVTSDHFRCRDEYAREEMGRTERSMYSARHAVTAINAAQVLAAEPDSSIEPLKPSPRTLKLLARRYKRKGTIRLSASPIK